MKNQNLILVVLLLFSVNFYSQSDEKSKIEETINTYFEGWKTGDTLKLGKAMHSTCKLKNLKEGKIIVIERKTYLSFFKPKEKSNDNEAKILSIDFFDKIGAVKCQLKTPKYLFIDYFNLMKEGDTWYIVDKISIRKEITK